MNPEFAIGDAQWVANGRRKFHKFGGNNNHINKSPIGEKGRDRIHGVLEDLRHRYPARFGRDNLGKLLIKFFFGS